MTPVKRETVVIAMSGGVDSSVAAALLVEQGYRVIGMMLRLWSEPGTEMVNRCCTPEAMALARRVSAHLDIPFYPVDVRERFRGEIVEYFLDGYAQGITPNPCLRCNRHIRFGALLDHATALGADALATGHYARLELANQLPVLRRGSDRDKDQSYVLSVLRPDQLAKARFPVGHLTKSEVRDLAKHFQLPTAERSESQDLCFLAGEDYRSFLLRLRPEIASPGEIVDPQGRVLGTHSGLPHYTIGQRIVLGIAAPAPLYVIEKRAPANQLVVGPRETLRFTTLQAGEANWLSPKPPAEPFRASVQVRYNSPDHPATIQPLDGDRFTVVFDAPLRAISPGQAAVIYDRDRVIGAGIITSASHQNAGEDYA